MKAELQFHELDSNQKKQVIGKSAACVRAGEDAGCATADPENWVYRVNERGIVTFYRYAPLRKYVALAGTDELASTIARDFGTAKQRLDRFLDNLKEREDVQLWQRRGRPVVVVG